MDHISKKDNIKWKWRIVCLVVAVILVIAAVLGLYVMDILGGLNHNELDPNDLGNSVITPEQLISGDTATDKSITNIVLFGIDERAGETRFRSDAIIIASIDKQHSKIKLSSVMRDMLVPIEGHGENKLGHAYYYGGPQLAVKTLNQNFGLDIREYATVNFAQLASIIDAVGGVEIDVSEAEMRDANNSIWEQVQVAGLAPTPIEEPGLQVLNGTQAVAYARIRHVGNADMERTDRQREVLGQIFRKAVSTNPLQYPDLARKFLPMVETSLSVNDILNLAEIMFWDVELEEARFPTNADFIDGGEILIDGVSYVHADLESISRRMHDFIYNDVAADDL